MKKYKKALIGLVPISLIAAVTIATFISVQKNNLGPIKINRSINVDGEVKNNDNIIFILNSLNKDAHSEWKSVKNTLEEFNKQSSSLYTLMQKLEIVNKNLTMKVKLTDEEYKRAIDNFADENEKIDKFLDAFPSEFRSNDFEAANYVKKLVDQLNGTTELDKPAKSIRISNKTEPRVVNLKLNNQDNKIDLDNKGYNNIVEIASIDTFIYETTSFKFSFKENDQSDAKEGLFVFRNDQSEPVNKDTTPKTHLDRLNIFGRWIKNDDSKDKEFDKFIVSADKVNSNRFKVFIQLKQGETIEIRNGFDGRSNAAAIKSFGYLSQLTKKSEVPELADSNSISKIKFFKTNTNFKTDDKDKDSNDDGSAKFDLFVGSNTTFSTPLYSRIKVDGKNLQSKYGPLKDKNGQNQSLIIKTSLENNALVQKVEPQLISFVQNTFDAKEQKNISFQLKYFNFGNIFFGFEVDFNKKYLSLNPNQDASDDGFAKKLELKKEDWDKKIFFENPNSFLINTSSGETKLTYSEFLDETTKAKHDLVQIYQSWVQKPEQEVKKMDFISKSSIGFKKSGDTYININPDKKTEKETLSGHELYKSIVKQENDKDAILKQLKSKYNNTINQYEVNDSDSSAIKSYGITQFERAFGGGYAFQKAVQDVVKLNYDQTSKEKNNDIEQILFTIVSSKFNDQVKEFNNEIQLEFSTQISNYLKTELKTQDDIRNINTKYYAYDNKTKLFSINKKEKQFDNKAVNGEMKLKGLIELLFKNKFGRALFSTTEVNHIYESLTNKDSLDSLYDKDILSSHQVNHIGESRNLMRIYSKLFTTFNSQYNFSVIRSESFSTGDKINFSTTTTEKDGLSVQKIMNEIFSKLKVEKGNGKAIPASDLFNQDLEYKLNYSNLLISATNIYTALMDRRQKNVAEQSLIDSNLRSNLMTPESMIAYSFLLNNLSPKSFTEDFSDRKTNEQIYNELQKVNLNNLVKIETFKSLKLIESLDSADRVTAIFLLILGLILIGISVTVLVGSKVITFGEDKIVKSVIVGAVVIGVVLVIMPILKLTGTL